MMVCLGVIPMYKRKIGETCKVMFCLFRLAFQKLLELWSGSPAQLRCLCTGRTVKPGEGDGSQRPPKQSVPGLREWRMATQGKQTNAGHGATDNGLVTCLYLRFTDLVAQQTTYTWSFTELRHRQTRCPSGQNRQTSLLI